MTTHDDDADSWAPQRWVDPATGLRLAMTRDPKHGTWNGYVEVPEEVDLSLLRAPGGWTGGFEGLPGFDTGHAWDFDFDPETEVFTPNKSEDWVRAEVTRLAGEAHALCSPWPRWTAEGSQATGHGAQPMIVLRQRDKTLLAGLARTISPRKETFWWYHLPKKVGQQKAPSVEAAVDALLRRGLPRPPEALLHDLVHFQPRTTP